MFPWLTSNSRIRLEVVPGLRDTRAVAWTGARPEPRRVVAGSPVRDMDALPVPDFDDFFAAIDDAAVPADELPLRISVEFAGGAGGGQSITARSAA